MGMNPEVKSLWLEALRSGKYPQTTGTLHRFEADGNDAAGFCCLGVLCDVAVKQGVIPEPVVDPTSGTRYRYGVAGNQDCCDIDCCPPGDSGSLPVEVQEWSGVESHGSRANGESLAELNDSGDYDFNDIADIIEAEF